MPHQPRRVVAVLTATLGLAATAGALPADPPAQAPAAALASVGITAEGIAAAGFTASEAITIAAQLGGQLAAIGSLEAQHAAVAELSLEVQQAHERLAADPGSPEAAAEVAARRSEHDAAAAQARSAEEAIIDAVLRDLPAPKIARVRAYIAGSRFRVEAAMRVAELSEGEWSRAELAVRAEERALRAGSPLDPESSQLLSDLRSRVEVVQAQQGLLLNLEGIRGTLAGQP